MIPFTDGEEPSQEELLEKQDRMDRHRENLAAGPSRAPGLDVSGYAELMKSELEPDTIELVEMVLASDFAKGNLNDAEINEIKYLREIDRLVLQAMHPGEDTLMQGKVRELVYSDNGRLDTDARRLKPLSAHDWFIIDVVLQAAHLMTTRSSGGFMWDQVGKSYSVSEIKDEKRDDSGGWFSFT